MFSDSQIELEVDSCSDNEKESSTASPDIQNPDSSPEAGKQKPLTHLAAAPATPIPNQKLSSPQGSANHQHNHCPTTAGDSSHQQQQQQQPTGFRPGRLTPLEILERVFPLQRRAVLELVLQGCNGDLVKAIEHFLSAQDTMMVAQQQAVLHASHKQELGSNSFMNDFSVNHAIFGHSTNSTNGNNGSNSQRENSHNGFRATSHRLHQISSAANGGGGGSSSKLTYSNMKSAFTPLSSSPTNTLHSAFTNHLSHFHPAATAEVALRHNFFPQGHTPHADILSPASHFSYSGLGMGLRVGGLSASYPGVFGSSFSFHPYRFNFRHSTSPCVRTPDKNSDKSALTDSDHISDAWDDGNSSRESKTLD